MQQPNAKAPENVSAADLEALENSDDPTVLAHKDDTIGNPGYYRDQNNLWRWRITAGEGEVLASASRGFPTQDEALADYDEQVKANTLPALKVFQPKNAPTGYQFGSGEDPNATQVVGNDAVEEAKEAEAAGEVVAPQNAKPDLGIASKGSSSSKDSKDK